MQTEAPMNGGDNYDRPKVLSLNFRLRRIRTSMTSRSEVRKKVAQFLLKTVQFGYMLENPSIF